MQKFRMLRNAEKLGFWLRWLLTSNSPLGGNTKLPVPVGLAGLFLRGPQKAFTTHDSQVLHTGLSAAAGMMGRWGLISMLLLALSCLRIVSSIEAQGDVFSLQALFEFHKRLSTNMLQYQVTEGNIGDYPSQIEAYYNFAKKHAPRQICEIGFNAGHSASVFNFASPTSNYQAFDLGNQSSPVDEHLQHGKHEYTAEAIRMIREYFRSNLQSNSDAVSSSPKTHRQMSTKKRVQVMIGDSTATVPQFAARHSSFVCDLVHVDGGHFKDVPHIDLIHTYLLASTNNNTAILLDDAVCSIREPFRSGTGCKMPQLAWQDLVKLGAIRQHACVELAITRGYCIGYFNVGEQITTALLQLLATIQSKSQPSQQQEKYQQYVHEHQQRLANAKAHVRNKSPSDEKLQEVAVDKQQR